MKGLLLFIGALWIVLPAFARPEPEDSSPTIHSEGDTLHLSNGKMLRGVQITAETPSVYVVEVQPVDITLRIPRSQVISVEYDDIDPALPGFGKVPGLPPETVLLPAEEMSAALTRKLTAVIPDPPVSFTDQDFVEEIQALATRAEVKLIIDQGVRALPVEQRRWTYAPASGISFRRILDVLTTTFPELRIDFKTEHVLIRLKEPASPEKAEVDSQPAALEMESP